MGTPRRRRSRSPIRTTSPSVGLTWLAERGRVRSGGGRRRGGRARHARPAGVRAGRHPGEGLVHPGAATRRDRPGARRRGGQADPGRADRGRSRRDDLPRRRRRGPAPRRRGDPAGPRAARHGPHRHRAALPDRPGRRDLAVQLPAEPVGAQARAGRRRRQPRRAQARHEDAAVGAVPGERRSRRRACPTGALSVLPMPRELGDRLVTDERFKLLTFTGSSAVGWAMKARAGKKKVILELGGNAGVIVDDDGRSRVGREAHRHRRVRVRRPELHLGAARVRARRASTTTFARTLVERVEALVVGDPLDPAHRRRAR